MSRFICKRCTSGRVENQFYVPISLVVPGSQIPFVKGGDRDKATASTF